MGNLVRRLFRSIFEAFPMAALPHTETQSLPLANQTDQAGFSWTVRLSRRRPEQAAKIGLVILGVFCFGLCFFHSLWLAGLPALALLLSLSEFLFPVRYTLSEHSAAVRYGLSSLEIRWEDVRHAYLTNDGIKLSPCEPETLVLNRSEASICALMRTMPKRSLPQCGG